VTRARPLAQAGSPPRVRVTRVVRVQYRLEWEYDGLSTFYAPNHADWESTGDDTELLTFPYLERRKRVRFVNSAPVAYRMAALRLIMARRDRYATEYDENARPPRPTGCTRCADYTDGHTGGMYPEPLPCKYHGGNGFEELVARLARWLRWRDSVLENAEQCRVLVERVKAHLPAKETT
jgi:hypothetical protein